MAEPVRKKLAAVADKGGAHKDMVEKYRGVLENILKTGSGLGDGLKAFAEAMVQENVNLVVSRPILHDFCTGLSSLPDAVAKDVSHFTLERLQPRAISFEEQARHSYCLSVSRVVDIKRYIIVYQCVNISLIKYNINFNKMY